MSDLRLGLALLVFLQAASVTSQTKPKPTPAAPATTVPVLAKVPVS